VNGEIAMQAGVDNEFPENLITKDFQEHGEAKYRLEATRAAIAPLSGLHDTSIPLAASFPMDRANS